MRHPLILLALSVAMAACSSSGDDLPANAIAFQGTTGSSRAGIESEADFTTFRVIGYQKAGEAVVNIFDKTMVTKNSTTQAWSYSNTQYWIPGASYKFFAVASSREDGEFYSISTPNPVTLQDWNNDSKLMTTDVTVMPDGQNEVLYARGYLSTDADGNPVNTITLPNPLETCPSAVSMNFKHAMTKVAIQFLDKTPEGFHAEISADSITTPKQGQFFLNSTDQNITWTNAVQETVRFAFTFLNGKNISNPLYLLPGNQSTLAFTITIYDDTDPDNSVIFSQKHYNKSPFSSAFPQFEPGNAYQFTIEATVATIHFSIQLTPWVEDIRHLDI